MNWVRGGVRSRASACPASARARRGRRARRCACGCVATQWGLTLLLYSERWVVSKYRY